MKRHTLVLGLIGLALAAVLALGVALLTPGAPADARAMSAANELYAAGHYAEATSIYEDFVAQGVEDAALFYNLGNAYFQQGDLGRAVLNYQRAAQLNPRDADIRANLALARAQVVDSLPAADSSPFSLLAKVTGNWLTLNETAVLALALWFGLGFLVLVIRQMRSGRAQRMLRATAVVLGIVLLALTLSLGSRTLIERSRPGGVVVVPTVAVNSGPGAEFASAYSLNGGAEVQLVGAQGDWVKLDLPDGAGEGWVPRSAIETLTGTTPREFAL